MGFKRGSAENSANYGATGGLIGPFDFAGEFSAETQVSPGHQSFIWVAGGRAELLSDRVVDTLEAGEAASVIAPGSTSVRAKAHSGARCVRLGARLLADDHVNPATAETPIEVVAPEPFALRSVTTRISGEARVFAGQMFGQTSPVETAGDLVAAEIRVAPGAEIAFTLNPEFEHGLLALSEGLRLQNVEVPRGEVASTEAGTATWGVKNASEAWAHAVIFGGAPQ